MTDYLLTCALYFGSGLFIGVTGLAAYIFFLGTKDDNEH